MGTPLSAFTVARNIITVILIMAFIIITTTTITIFTLLLEGSWLTPGPNSCPLQGS
jgi:hypothetical protein